MKPLMLLGFRGNMPHEKGAGVNETNNKDRKRNEENKEDKSIMIMNGGSPFMMRINYLRC